MRGKDLQDQDEFEQDQQENQNNLIRQRIRRQAYNRTTDYAHPSISFFDHQPINNKQSQQLRKQLVNLYKPKVQQVRRQYDNQQLSKNYQNVYSQFIKMTLKNEAQQRQLTQSIGQMYEMADILLNPPDFKTQQIFLYSKNQPYEQQQQQIDKIFNRYQQAYKAGQKIQQNHAEQTIKRAKQFLRNQFS